MTTYLASKDYSKEPNTHPMAFGANVGLSDSTVFSPSTRGVIFDVAGTAKVRFAGTTRSSSSAIVGVSGDISANASGSTLTSTTSSKFATLLQGDAVRTTGFANPQNNGDFIIESITNSNKTIKLGKAASQTVNGGVSDAVLVDETPTGAAVKITVPDRYNQTTALLTVLAGVFYPLNIDMLFSTGTVTVTGAEIFW